MSHATQLSDNLMSILLLLRSGKFENKTTRIGVKRN